MQFDRILIICHNLLIEIFLDNLSYSYIFYYISQSLEMRLFHLFREEIIILMNF